MDFVNTLRFACYKKTECIYGFFSKGDKFDDLLFTFLDEVSLSNWDRLLKERIHS